MKMSHILTTLVTTAFFSFATHAAEIGKEAPSLSAPSTKGETVTLQDYIGKVVVLEWINFDCPFVKKHYSSGNIPKLQERYTGKEVVWISVNSSAPGKQGYLEAEALAERAAKEGNRATHILLDTDGAIGKAYGAKTTPQIVLINAKGELVYNGAIDSIASADKNDIPIAEPYAAEAIDALLSGKAIEKPKTQPYGCSVKY